MRKFFCTILCSLSMSFAFAADDLGSESTVYFCVDDVEMFVNFFKTIGLFGGTEANPVDPELNAYLKEGEIALNVSKKLNDTKITPIRHCFLALAKRIKSGDSTDTDVLAISTTKGYGWYGSKLDKNGISNEENLPHLSKKYVACIPVIKKGDLLKDTRGRDIRDMIDVWGDVIYVMDAESEQSYNGISHTCCTAAYTTLIKLFNATFFEETGNKVDALKKANEKVEALINPTSFQAGGLGMVYGQWIGFVAGSSYSSASMYVKISTFLPKKELEFYKYIYDNIIKGVNEEETENLEPKKEL
jgi:hypothetical protein